MAKLKFLMLCSKRWRFAYKERTVPMQSGHTNTDRNGTASNMDLGAKFSRNWWSSSSVLRVLRLGNKFRANLDENRWEAHRWNRLWIAITNMGSNMFRNSRGGRIDGESDRDENLNSQELNQNPCNSTIQYLLYDLQTSIYNIPSSIYATAKFYSQPFPEIAAMEP